MTDAPMLEAEKAKQPSVQARAIGDPMYDAPQVAGARGGLLWWAADYADAVPPWTYFPAMRDRALRVFARGREPILKGGLYNMRTRAENIAFQVEGPLRAKKYALEVMQKCAAGGGLKRLIGLTIRDYLTQDNGMFWELCYTGNPVRPVRPVDRLIAPYIMPLDSAQCWRTFDPEFPVVYVNPLNGEFRKLHATRVYMASSDEQPDELARGIGYCGVSRALEYSAFMRSVLQYKNEKISGQFDRALLLLSGASIENVVEASQAAKRSAVAKGATTYMGVPVLARTQQDSIKAQLIDFASLPDKFDTQADITMYVYTLALAFGVDAREFWPSTSSGATKADASIQHLKSQGKGIADLITAIENGLRFALPDTLEVGADYTDDEQDELRSRINNTRSATYSAMMASGLIDRDEARAHAVKEGLLEVELLTERTEEVVDADPVTEATPLQAENVTANVEAGETPAPPDETRVDLVTATRAFKVLDQHDLRAALFTQTLSVMLEAVSGHKDYDTARAQLTRNMVNAEFDADSPTDAAKLAFARQFRQQLLAAGELAYLAGMRDGGVIRPVIGAEDRRRLNGWLASQSDYIEKYTDNLFAAGEDYNRENHADMWANKSLYEAWYLGFEVGARGKKVKWIYNPLKEHCEDCLRYNGQVHTLEAWSARGIRPRSGALKCGGYHCGCNLEITDDPIGGNF